MSFFKKYSIYFFVGLNKRYAAYETSIVKNDNKTNESNSVLMDGKKEYKDHDYMDIDDAQDSVVTAISQYVKSNQSPQNVSFTKFFNNIFSIHHK